PSSQSSTSLKERKKIVLHIFFPILVFIIFGLCVLIVFNVYNMGKEKAVNQREFKVVEISDEKDCMSINWVVLTENDDKLLLAELTEKNGIPVINTGNQKVIENIDYGYKIIKYKEIEVIKENDG
ncbi:MAG: hypothetical protein K2J47_08615, partial [Ruminococcus sp.]|nr:hypothetical protein [Ruminococcus sp.]